MVATWSTSHRIFQSELRQPHSTVAAAVVGAPRHCDGMFRARPNKPAMVTAFHPMISIEYFTFMRSC